MTRSAASQQSTSYAHAQYPCFHPLPESQPVLPCLLRRLLQKGKAQEALSLATSHSQAPHFARSMEWLLFTSLEINNEQMARPSRCAACLHHPGLLLGLRLLYNPQHVIEFSFLFCACTATGQGSSVQLMRVLSMNSCSIQNLLLNSTLTCASCHVRSQQQVHYVLSAVNVKTTWTKPPMDSRCQCFASDAQSHICLSLH